MSVISQNLKIIPARGLEHLTFNLYNFNFFRKTGHGKAMLFFGESRLLALVIALPYILGCELAFLRGERYFVKLDRQVVAVLVLRDKRDALYVASLAVAPECRKRGIATYILSHCAGVAKRLRKKWLELTVLKTNISARQLYERFGFSYKEERKWSFVMRKSICGSQDSLRKTLGDAKILNSLAVGKK